LDPRFTEKSGGHGPDLLGQFEGPDVEAFRFEDGPLPLASLEEAAKPAGPKTDEIGPGDKAGQAFLNLAAAHEAAGKGPALTGGPGARFDDMGRCPGQPAPSEERLLQGIERDRGRSPGEQTLGQPGIPGGGFFYDRNVPAEFPESGRRGVRADRVDHAGLEPAPEGIERFVRFGIRGILEPPEMIRRGTAESPLGVRPEGVHRGPPNGPGG